MEVALILRFLHVVGAAVLLGTGTGIAFFMVMARRSGKPELIAHVAQTIVIADALFTLTAVILQPITGYLLVLDTGWSLAEGWITLSLALYVVVGLFWLPVVWIQIRLRDLALAAALAGTPLPPAWFSLYRIWFVCGFPAFLSVMTIVWLMLSRPDIALF